LAAGLLRLKRLRSRSRESFATEFYIMAEPQEPHPKPKGTIAVMIIFALLIVALWSSVYIALLLRGATQ
jgi:hypothetical protein